MEFFNFIETFFFISLAITFVLIMMLVYHFKERLSVLEKKTNTMFDIVNNIVQELNCIRNQSIPQRMESPTSIPLSNIFSQMGNKIFVSEEETDDDDECSIEELQEEETKEESIKLINIDFSTKESLDDIEVDELKEESIDEELEEPEEVESLMESYKKLDVSALRTLVSSKDLTIDTKKMKKTELLKILETI